MKLLKKLLPIATLASTAAIVAPIVTSCGNGFEMIDVSKEYKPTIEQYKPSTEEAEGVTADKALEIYLNAASKNFEIVKQDALVYSAGKSVPEGLTAQVGIKINKIDVSKQTIDFEVQQTSKGKYTSEGITSEGDSTVYVKVTNAKLAMSYYGTWNVSIGKYSLTEFGDEVIVGKASGWFKTTQSGTIVEEAKFSGKERTINKDTTLPTEKQELAEYESIMSLANRYFTSYYLKNLKAKQ